MSKNLHCDDCGEAGRVKELILHSWDAIGYYCHDEEKSCYNYVYMNAVG